MPIKRAAIKHLRQTKKRTAKNRAVKKDLKAFIKRVRKTLVEKDHAKIKEYASRLQKVIDKAVHKKVIKSTGAARRKSRLMKQIHRVLAER